MEAKRWGKRGSRMSRRFISFVFFFMMVRSAMCEKLNKKDRDKILLQHNKLRNYECASNMNMLEWDDELETQAHEYAKKCIFAHASKQERNGAGENIAVRTSDAFLTSIEDGWFCSEKKMFSYGEITNDNYKKVGHYTAMVWAGTRKLGCAWVKCESIKNWNDRKGYIGVCRYKSAGNIIGEKPYKKGKACTECAEGEKCCNGLCTEEGTECKEEEEVKCEEPGANACGDNFKGTGVTGTVTAETGNSGSGSSGTEGDSDDDDDDDDGDEDEGDSDKGGDSKEGSGARGMTGVGRSLMLLVLVSLLINLIMIN